MKGLYDLLAKYEAETNQESSPPRGNSQNVFATANQGSRHQPRNGLYLALDTKKNSRCCRRKLPRKKTFLPAACTRIPFSLPSAATATWAVDGTPSRS